MGSQVVHRIPQARRRPLQRHGRSNDTVVYDLMDDGVLVEPRLGVRPWAASATFEEGLSILLGRDALNVKKLAEERTFDTKALLWGLGHDTEAGTCQLPELKLLKGVHLLTELCFNQGNRAILLIEVQRLRGNATYWITCQPSLRPELGAIDVLLAQQQPGDPYVCPKGSLGQVTAAYQEFWNSVDVIPVLVTRPETWEATFTAGLEGFLNPRDRLALPGAAERVLWIGGDATLEVAAATDWGAKVYITFWSNRTSRRCETSLGPLETTRPSFRSRSFFSVCSA